MKYVNANYFARFPDPSYHRYRKRHLRIYNQLNVCTTSVTEGEVGPVKLVLGPQSFITDRSKVVVLMWSLLAVLVSEFR